LEVSHLRRCSLTGHTPAQQLNWALPSDELKALNVC
jgi:hypothetical protein